MTYLSFGKCQIRASQQLYRTSNENFERGKETQDILRKYLQAGDETPASPHLRVVVCFTYFVQLNPGSLVHENMAPPSSSVHVVFSSRLSRDVSREGAESEGWDWRAAPRRSRKGRERRGKDGRIEKKKREHRRSAFACMWRLAKAVPTGWWSRDYWTFSRFAYPGR